MQDRLPLLVLSALLLPPVPDAAASNGMRPPANSVESYGRGGVEIGMPASGATSMYGNPASIAFVRDEQVDVMPAFAYITASYEDPENGRRNTGTNLFPFANFAWVFDFKQTEDELLEDLRENDPLYRALTRPDRRETPELDPILGLAKIHRKRVRIHVGRFPQSVSLQARGASGWISDISVVANYTREGPDKFYSHIVASTGARAALSPTSSEVARFPALSNPLAEEPSEVVVYFKLEADLASGAEVRVLLDGRDAGGARVSSEDFRREKPRRTPAPDLPRFRHELWRAEQDYFPLKIGVGLVTLSGAGADFNLATELYPEGTQHFDDFKWGAFGVTAAAKVGDLFAVGLTLQLHVARLAVTSPVSEDSAIMKGETFPSGSLDSDLGGEFGVPPQFGPAMKWAMNTSATHAPGTWITHSWKENDLRFAEITGTAKLENATSFGVGAKFGLLVPVTERLTVGFTFQSQSFMRNFRGKAKIDYNRQLEAFTDNPTVGHSNEVMSIFATGVNGVPLGDEGPTELRFTFKDVWETGVVHVFANGAEHPLFLSGFPMSTGSVKSNLPNGGANGFAAEYDVEIEDFQLPMEIGLGASYLLFDWIRIGFDYKRIFWSQTMTDFKVKLSNGSNPDVNALIGSDSFDISLPLNWKDQNVFAVAIEVYPFDWLSLRAGWNYGKNPIPKETLLPILPVISEHHLSAGISVRWGSFRLGAAFMAALENSVTISDSEQSRDLNGATFRSGQNFFVLGVEYDY